MLKKTITYTDFNDVEQTEDFYFNLNRAELLDMEAKSNGSLKNKLERLINTRDLAEIMTLFKDIILNSYGIKSDDGKRFIKSKELSEAFSQTNAFEELYIELSTNTEAAINFITGIIPAKLADKLDKDEIEKIKAKANAGTKEITN